MKKLFAIILAAVCLFPCCVCPAAAAEEGGFAHFNRVNTYTDGRFSDVPADAWYRTGVAAAYELGLMKGSDDGSFHADGNVTMAETVALAARLHSIYHTGAAEFVQGDPWYRVYADYALENGLLKADAADYGAPATRREFAAVLSRALPAEALPAVNDVADGAIPDVKTDSENAAEIYLLYRAGILTGNDTRGRFAPETPIQRSAVATIVTRMAYRSLRVKYTLEESRYPDLDEQEKAENDFFSDTAMLGNSLVQGMQLYSGLSTMDFYCKEGIGVSSAASYADSLCAKQYGKIYIELGINEIYMDPASFAASYGAIIDRLRSGEPNAEIYIMAITPVTKTRSDAGTFTMKRINALNEALYDLALEKDCWYLDICTPLEDGTGYLQAAYAGWDGSPHLSGEGYAAWESILRTHYAA